MHDAQPAKRFAIVLLLAKGDPGSVRRKGGSLYVTGLVRELRRAGSVSVDDPQIGAACPETGKCDPCSIRGPCWWRRVGLPQGGKRGQTRAVDVEYRQRQLPGL